MKGLQYTKRVTANERFSRSQHLYVRVEYGILTDVGLSHPVFGPLL